MMHQDSNGGLKCKNNLGNVLFCSIVGWKERESSKTFEWIMREEEKAGK